MVYMMATEWKVNLPEGCDGMFLHCLGISEKFSLCEATDNVGSRKSESKPHAAGALRARRVSTDCFRCATKDMVALNDAQTAAMLAFLKTRRGDKEF